MLSQEGLLDLVDYSLLLVFAELGKLTLGIGCWLGVGSSTGLERLSLQAWLKLLYFRQRVTRIEVLYMGFKSAFVFVESPLQQRALVDKYRIKSSFPRARGVVIYYFC